MKKVYIAHTRILTALGTLPQTWETLLSGKTGIARTTRFDTGPYPSSLAACVPGFEQQGERSMIHALLDRLLLDLPAVSSNPVVITATTKAGVDNLERLWKKEAAKPDDVLPSNLPSLVVERMGRGTAAFNVNAACASSTIALARAASLIALGAAEAVAVCALDLVTEFVFAGFASLRILSSQPARPFDKRRDGLSLGEGGAFFLLVNHETAKELGAERKVRIAGWGVANDAEHIVTPEASGRGLHKAVLQALKQAAIGEDAIGAVGAHGTGTLHNDQMELAVIKKLFGDRCLPVYSIKGALGHTMGAAGAIEAACAACALEEGLVPPTIGCIEPEDDAAPLVTTNVRPFSGDFVLTLNSGFGGASASLVLERCRT